VPHTSSEKTEATLSAEQLADRLLPLLSDLFSPQHDATPLIAGLATLRRAEQEMIVHWVGIIARTNAELAHQFARHAPLARDLLGQKEIEAWVLQAMDVYDHEGLYAAVRVLSDVKGYAIRHEQQRSTVTLKQVSRVLEAFLQGLSGRRLSLEPGDTIWTDTETVYLPARIHRFSRREDNFSLAKCLAAMLWAQTRFGSFALAENGELQLEALLSYENTTRAQELFVFFESHRLLSRIEAELPGLAREIGKLMKARGPGEDDRHWQAELGALSARDASVTDSLTLVRHHYPKAPPTTPFSAITFNLATAKTTIAQRIASEREALRQALAQIAQQQQTAQGSATTEAPENQDFGKRFQLRSAEESEEGDGLQISLSFDGKPVVLSPELRKLLQSILQDVNSLPADYLAASASDALPKPSALSSDDAAEDETAYGQPYPEWDFRRRHYRRDWCYVRETEVAATDPAFVETTLAKYVHALSRLRKTFEALRSEDRWLCRQRLGDDLDLDAVVDSLADQHAGLEADDRLYRRLSRNNRNIAVLFMVDMSGSTKGWVNEAEREALVLLCEALQILGDRYAIYGFSGMTRRRCEIFKVKQFEETYSEVVRGRIAGIEARDYTRMGVSIRYLNKLLEDVPARTKLLITLSDGKPDDFDGYGGDYGIEDTRQALIESRQAGIHPFCITIDREARDYLPHMYGRHSYAVIDKVHELPLKVAEIYRRLTH